MTDTDIQVAEKRLVATLPDDPCAIPQETRELFADLQRVDVEQLSSRLAQVMQYQAICAVAVRRTATPKRTLAFQATALAMFAELEAIAGLIHAVSCRAEYTTQECHQWVTQQLESLGGQVDALGRIADALMVKAGVDPTQAVQTPAWPKQLADHPWLAIANAAIATHNAEVFGISTS